MQSLAGVRPVPGRSFDNSLPDSSRFAAVGVWMGMIFLPSVEDPSSSHSPRLSRSYLSRTMHMRETPAYCRILGLATEYSTSVRKFTATYVRPMARIEPWTR